jgi:hypothetical protein
MEFDLIEFLVAYDYLSDTDRGDAVAITAAVAKAQEIYGLPVTGQADEMTLRAFARTPRCGVTDAESAREAINRWGIKHLTYAIEATPNGRDLTPETATNAMVRAFASWSGVCGLTFERISNASQANLRIGTGRGRRAGFDGPSGTLAWAELPPSDGHRGQLVCRFDLDENYVVGQSASGVLLENVACHEFGHLLGLSHTNVAGSLMLPTYSPRVAKPQRDDIERVVARYGAPSTPPIVPPPTGPVAGPAKVQILMADNSVYQFENPTKIR